MQAGAGGSLPKGIAHLASYAHGFEPKNPQIAAVVALAVVTIGIRAEPRPAPAAESVRHRHPAGAPLALSGSRSLALHERQPRGELQVDHHRDAPIELQEGRRLLAADRLSEDWQVL